MKVVELKPIKERPSDFEQIEARIKTFFRKHLYYPLLAELNLPQKTIQNALSPFLKAIEEGRVTFAHGTVRGKLNAEITKELKSYGAIWDKTTGTFRISKSSLPPEIRTAVNLSSAKFEDVILKIDIQLAKNLPVNFTESIKTDDLFDKVLFKTDRDLQSSLKNITVTPKLSKENRQRIADEWQANMNLWIKDFTEKEIASLRKDVQKAAVAGNRRESLVESIQRSYEVTENKAKFLARQETSLLMTKFKEVRYQAAGVNEYKWGCVAGSALHPVRPAHKALDGKIFSWSNPPITTEPGEPVRRNNPGQDYNCRCFAKPIVRF